MNRKLLRRSLFVLILSFGATSLWGQANQFTRFFITGPDDAARLTRAYIYPFIEGVSYGVNGGWYHTARTHQKFGFDLSITATAVFLPAEQRYFMPSTLGLENTDLLSTTGISPTLIGEETAPTFRTELMTNSGPIEFTFDGAEGLDFQSRWIVQGLGVPMVQAGIGLIKNTDLKIRFLPRMDLGSVTEAGIFGVGILHDLKQWFPGGSVMPIDLSLLVGFTRVGGSVNTATSEFPSPANDQRVQEMPFNANSWDVQVVASKKLNMFTFYGAVGYQNTKSEASLKGSYIVYSDPAGDVVMTDPFRFSFSNASMNITGGIRWQTGQFVLHADYSRSEYNTVTGGIGFSVK